MVLNKQRFPLETMALLVQFVSMSPTELRTQLPRKAARRWAIQGLLLVILSGQAVSGQTQELAPANNGAVLFNTYCAACHLLKQKQVGPSLIEIASIHKDAPQGIVDWAMNPGKKRPDTIQMPPMNYVGSDNLKSIADYILSATEGMEMSDIEVAEEVEVSIEKPARPRVQRVFMPDAGPAAVAVALPGSLSYCWDAGSCSLRYFWQGDFIDAWPVWKGNGNALSRILGERQFETSSASPFHIDDKLAGSKKFLGYRLRNGSPEFHYELNGVRFREWIQPLPNDSGIRLIFETDGVGESLVWKPEGRETENLLAGYEIESNRGSAVEGGGWKWNAAESRFFHITIKTPQQEFAAGPFDQ